jgi:hypothetical protein
MERTTEIAFANQLRNAREAALKDAEAFDGILHAVERLGRFLTKRSDGNLGQYGSKLQEIAARSPLAEEVPKRFRGLLTTFSSLLDLVRHARNDAFHEGASARHLTGHAIELALILEDALRSSEAPVVADYMVRNPVCAELWQPIGFVRQQMLASSFSFLPVLSKHRIWCLVSDRAIAAYLGRSWPDRKDRMASLLGEAPIELKRAKLVQEDTSLDKALTALKDAPLLVRQKGKHPRILGIVTAFDLL